MQTSSSTDLTEVLFQLTALPSNGDTQFLFANNQQTLRSNERPPDLNGHLTNLLQILNSDPQAIRGYFIKAVNEGNFIEIECELLRQEQQGLAQRPEFSAWQRIAAAIAKLQRDEYFHYRRIYILKTPFVELNGESQQQAIDNVKSSVIQSLGIGVSPDDISWDALAYKVIINASEYFCQLNPQLQQQLTQPVVSIIDELQDQIDSILNTKLSEFRMDEKTREDQFVTDKSVLLETLICAQEDLQLPERIKTIGSASLIQYIAMMQPLFVQGHIPGSILPAKLYACQDVVSGLELRTSIQSLAEEQILQKEDVIDNPNVRHHMKILADDSTDMRTRWSKKQSASLNQGKFINQSLAEGLRSFGETPFQPQRDLAQQVAGGSNDLGDQLDMQMNGTVINLSPADKELVRQHLSTLLACLRIRFDATQTSQAELVTKEDVEHLEICKLLSHQCDPDTQKVVFEMATVLKESIVNGHNKVKLKGYGVSDQAVQDAIANIEGNAKNVLQSIPLLQADAQEGSQLFQTLMKCIYLALAQKNRVDNERRLRYQRRAAVYNASNRYT